MLVWSNGGRAAVWLAFALIFGVIYFAPVTMIALASVAGQWNDVLPSHLSFANYGVALAGASGEALRVSIITGLTTSFVALVSGTWAALALRNVAPMPRRVLEMLFFIPSAVPSVSVGLGLLVAFIGPNLTLRLVREIWPQIPLGDLDVDNGGKNEKTK